MTPPLAPGLLVAAPRSGAGKTLVTIGLQRAFRAAGLRVAAAKCGPDYIDPGFHAAATERPSINLDGFAMAPAMLRGLAAKQAEGADLLIAETAMGLYDGAGAHSSGAAVAGLTGWPILLVVDAEGAGQSVAAVAHGMAGFPGAPPIAGVIVNRVASDRHAAMIAEGFAALDLPLLGMIRREAALAVASRHLGLVQAREDGALTSGSTRSPRSSRATATSPQSARRHVRPPPPLLRRRASARPASGSRSPPTMPSLSSIRTSPPGGARRGRRSSPSRRSPTKRRRPIATLAGCRAAIPNFMRGGSRAMHA